MVMVATGRRSAPPRRSVGEMLVKPWCIVAVDDLVAEGFYKVGDPKFVVL
jgi:hypothetical protein